MDGFTWFAPTVVAGVTTAPTIQIVNGYSQTMATQTTRAELQKLKLGTATQYRKRSNRAAYSSTEHQNTAAVL